MQDLNKHIRTVYLVTVIQCKTLWADIIPESCCGNSPFTATFTSIRHHSFSSRKVGKHQKNAYVLLLPMSHCSPLQDQSRSFDGRWMEWDKQQVNMEWVKQQVNGMRQARFIDSTHQDSPLPPQEAVSCSSSAGADQTACRWCCSCAMGPSWFGPSWQHWEGLAHWMQKFPLQKNRSE